MESVDNKDCNSIFICSILLIWLDGVSINMTDPETKRATFSYKELSSRRGAADISLEA